MNLRIFKRNVATEVSVVSTVFALDATAATLGSQCHEQEQFFENLYWRDLHVN